MTFLPHPLPERVTFMSFFDPIEALPILSIGLQIIDKTPNGLKVTPSPRVVIAIGTYGNEEEKTVDLDFITARHIARRIVEFCDAGEKKGQ